jgi:hypothetical protein
MSVYRFPECAKCAFHDEEPVMCEKCVNGSEFWDKLFDQPPQYGDFYDARGIE